MRRCLILFGLLITVNGLLAQTPTTPYLLNQVGRSVQGELNSLDADLSQHAAEWAALSGGDLSKLSSRDFRRGLKSILARNSSATNAALIDREGFLKIIEPSKFRKHEGESIRSQPQFQKLLRTGEGVMSPTLRMVEGFDAVDVESPILGPRGEVVGSVSAIFEPKKLFGRYEETLLKDMPFRLTVVQPDGRIVYRSVGFSPFTNLQEGSTKAAPGTQQLVSQILAQPTGEGIFTLNTADASDDHAAYWISVGLHGTEMRLVLISDVSRTVAPARVDRAAAMAKLQKLAAQSEVGDAVGRRNTDVLDDVFIRFIQQNPEIYSVQAVDSGNQIFAGQPIGGAPVGYRLSEKRAADREALAALKSGKPTQYEATLLEGGRALFTVVPIPKTKGAALMAIVRYR